MRVSAIFACVTALLASFVQAHPLDEDSMSLAERSSNALMQPAHILAVRSDSTSFESSSMPLSKRSDRWAKGNNRCPGPFLHHDTNGFKKALNGLRKRTDRPTLAAAGKWPTCEDFCYADGTQISWCNEDKKRKTLVSYNSIVEGIEVMLESSKCTYKNGTKLETGGAIFHPTNWYVFAGKCWPDKR